jgi:hypothetical protein
MIQILNGFALQLIAHGTDTQGTFNALLDAGGGHVNLRNGAPKRFHLCQSNTARRLSLYKLY